MNVLRRAILYDTRRPGKSLTLFLLFLLITLLCTMSFAVLDAVQNAASSLRETVGASFTLRGKPLEIDADGNDYSMEFAGISPQDVQQIASNPEIKAYNAQRTTLAMADGFIYPSGMPSGTVSGNTESAWNQGFTSGILTLAEGRHITQKDENVAIISRELVEENSLHLGDKLSFSEPPTTVKIIGIYESDPSMEFDTDTIFTDLCTVGNSIERVDFFVNDPTKLETAMARIEGDNYTLQANTAEYDAIATQLATIGRLTAVLIIAAIAVSATVLLLILAMRVRGRTHEVGILIAVGIGKSQIFTQFIMETMLLFAAAMLVSCPVSYAAAAQFQVYLREMIGATTVAIPARNVILQYAAEMAVVVVAILVAGYPIMRLQSKEILSKMS
ncbi:MAG: FtsX-like permease family protein [Acutalibacter sp.]|uniref:ABC transporter permease n=1 Tax=Acutalibacter sp. TaxID=1918636 RepID=UPI0021701430|nr:ABC transporter permease [Acutalibacter sp.]MCI9226059.1 FtsX-like permease family protein [Acutalibacter sp.]